MPQPMLPVTVAVPESTVSTPLPPSAPKAMPLVALSWAVAPLTSMVPFPPNRPDQMAPPVVRLPVPVTEIDEV